MGVDKQNMSIILENFAKQCREGMNLAKGMYVPNSCSSIVVLGMGGSGVCGDLLKVYLNQYDIPVTVVRDYDFPAHADKETLVFSISYSGNTEETLSATQQALRRKLTVVGISSGGALEGMCKKHIKVPKDLQPRCALGYLFFPLLGVLHNSNIIEVKNAELNEVLAMVHNPGPYKEHAQLIAGRIKDRVPIFYSTERLRVLAMRLKTQCNENAKTAAFFNTFSEMNHNEIEGYATMQRSQFYPIFIRDSDDAAEHKKRMAITEDLISHTVDSDEIHTKGKYLLTRLFSVLYLGDWLSYTLAIKKRIDPTPVDVIEKLKKRMKL